jgi:hypothetical protein
MSMTLAVAEGHLVNMGKMIEEMEGKLRNSLDQVLASRKFLERSRTSASTCKCIYPRTTHGCDYRSTLGRPGKWFAHFGHHQKYLT